MQRALQLAREAADAGEVPVAAVIVDSASNQVVAEDRNRVIELADPTAHAEMLAIRQAGKALGSERLTTCDLYVTLEPCPMCAGAISLARLRRLYYAAPDPKSGGVDHGPQIFSHSTCHHRPQVYGGIGEEQAAKILRDFFVERR